jgi:hypothetical protein
MRMGEDRMDVKGPDDVCDTPLVDAKYVRKSLPGVTLGVENDKEDDFRKR